VRPTEAEIERIAWLLTPWVMRSLGIVVTAVLLLIGQRWAVTAPVILTWMIVVQADYSIAREFG
jgi:hypothetical protein